MNPADTLHTVAQTATQAASQVATGLSGITLSAYYLAWAGIVIMVLVSCVGSALTTVRCRCAAIGAIKKRPDIFGPCMILTALPSTQGLYGFGGYFIIKAAITPQISILAALGVLAAGLILGIVGILSSIFQARVVSVGIESMGQGHDVFGNTLILAVYPELYSIIAFATAFLISGQIKVF